MNRQMSINDSVQHADEEIFTHKVNGDQLQNRVLVKTLS